MKHIFAVTKKKRQLFFTLSKNHFCSFVWYHFYWFSFWYLRILIEPTVIKLQATLCFGCKVRITFCFQLYDNDWW